MAKIKLVQCVGCDATIEEEPSISPEKRLPCPMCGSVGRKINVSFEETIEVGEIIGIKGNHSGEKKPFIKQISGDKLQYETGKLAKLVRIIDRDNDLYYEQVTDPETGKVFHECKEPLSAHREHGSAKKSKEIFFKDE